MCFQAATYMCLLCFHRFSFVVVGTPGMRRMLPGGVRFRYPWLAAVAAAIASRAVRATAGARFGVWEGRRAQVALPVPRGDGGTGIWPP
jgi:hypothetical protein